MHEAPERRGSGPVVVFSGGGTGGHLYPALALAEALEALRPEIRAYFIGAERGIEARVLPARGREHLLLPVRGFARRGGVRNLAVLPRLAGSLWTVLRRFRRLRPELVVVTGGYAGAPAGIGAGLRRIPLVLQEQNAVPGVTTRLLARWATEIHLAFPEAASALPGRARGRVVPSGNPVRPPEAIDDARARRDFGLAPEGAVLLVVGGSQGSRALNEAVLEAVRAVRAGGVERPDRLQLLWATGPAHLEAVREAVDDVPAWLRPVGYIDDMERALGIATLAVSRAGAMATSEFLAWGVPMVLVPLPTAAADHQSRNAEALEASGAALHLPEATLTGRTLWDAVTGLFADSSRLRAMSAAARERGRPEAAARIAESLAALFPRSDGGTT